MKKKADRRQRRKAELMKPGMKAWLDIEGISLSDLNLRPAPKLNPRYYGPYTVLAQPGQNRFRLEMPKDSICHPVFHVNRLKAWSDPDMIKYRKKPRKRLPAELRFKDGDDWEVEEILDDDLKRKTQYYHVRWKGGEASWIPRADLLPGARKMLDAYDKEHGIEKGQGKSKAPKRKRR